MTERQPSPDAIVVGAEAPHWRHRHLLDVDVLTADEIELVMRTADSMKGILARPIAKVPALRGRNVTIIFWEASTRTRVSFEVAAKNLSADVVNIAASTSSVTKGESLVDTIRTVQALGAQMLVMRHGTSPRSISTGTSSTAETGGTPIPRRPCSTSTRCASVSQVDRSSGGRSSSLATSSTAGSHGRTSGA
jgi:hypothetical protein